MFTCGWTLKFWNVSDLTNISCIIKLEYDEFLYGHSLTTKVNFAMIVFHPDDDFFLIGTRYGYSGNIFLVNYSNSSNPVNVVFERQSFCSLQIITKETSILVIKNWLVLNSIYVNSDLKVLIFYFIKILN